MKKLIILLAFIAVGMYAQAQSVGVFVNDQTGSSTNIRNAPKGKVVHRIKQSVIAMLEVESPRNGWWQICDNSYFGVEDNYEGMVKLTGSRTGYWIHYSVLAVSTRNYGDETLYLYAQPSTNSKKVYTIYTEMSLRPTEVRGDWVKCETFTGHNIGWIQAEWLCGNALTNCN